MKILMAEHTFLDSEIKVGCHHISRILNNNNEILYLSIPITPYHFFKKDKKDFYRKYSIYKNNGELKDNGIIEYIPMTLLPIYNKPIFKSKFAANNTIKFCFPNIKSILKKYDFENVDLLLISIPHFAELLDIVNYKKSIYRITDDYSKFDKLPDNIINVEQKLIKQVDKVIVTSMPLYNKFIKYSPKKIEYIHNGVDIANFRKDTYVIPNEYTDSKFKKKVVYVGAIESWFDLNLMDLIAKDNVDVGFYIIGKPKINIDVFLKSKNVFFIGSRQYSKIPDYLYYSNVGIIPFINNSLIRSVSPIKLYEYSSVGLPVVTTNWEEISNINEKGIFLSNSHIEFAQNLKAALDMGKQENLMRFAENNSWETICHRIINV